MLQSLITLAAGDPAQHVYNHPFITTESGLWLWSGNVGNLILSMIILMAGGWYVASKVKTGPASEGADRYVTKNKFAHVVEVMCVYLREEVIRPLLSDRTEKLTPVLLTIFFFVLVNNLLGMIPLLDIFHLLPLGFAERHITPFGGTATQNIWVTGGLALIAALIFNGAALKRLGLMGYLKHLTADAPWYVWPIVVPIEFAGQIVIKPVALAIRLFANMTAGHILLATLYSFVAAVWGSGLLLKGSVTVISVGGAIFITILELGVALLQAFIFMFLTALFISLMDHHDEHGHEHGHDHADGHEHAIAHAAHA